MAKKNVNPVQDGYPEKGTIDEKSLRKMYKKLSDEQINEWLELEGLTYKQSGHESIDRMRACMTITNFHFPKVTAAKKASKYADYTTEQLVEMCIDNDLVLKDDKGDMRILRMYAIVALREAGVIG